MTAPAYPYTLPTPSIWLRLGCGIVGQVTLSVYSCPTQKPEVT